jgi:plastocyanin
MGCAEHPSNRETSVKAIWLVLAIGIAGEPRTGITVDIRSFGFRNAALEVPAGTRVTWTNRDPVEHTVTSATADGHHGKFAARLPGPGASFSYTFEQAGTYRYFCDRHHFMRGEIRVTPQNQGAH